MLVHVANEYTQLPGGRYPRQGADSGEGLREDLLIPRFDEAQRRYRTLLVDLRGVRYGYPIGFLEEAFGGLARARPAAVGHIHVVDDDNESAALALQLMREATLTKEERGERRMKRKTDRYEVRIGSLAPPLFKQLKIPKDAARHLQADADAVVRLKVRGIIGEGASNMACRRLLKRMETELPGLLEESNRKRTERAAKRLANDADAHETAPADKPS